MNRAQRQLLVTLADRYETASFIEGDPSWFMHQVSDPFDQETTAFLAMCLSYGSRQQFLPKIEQLMNIAQWHPYDWIATSMLLPSLFLCRHPRTAHSLTRSLSQLRNIRALCTDCRRRS